MRHTVTIALLAVFMLLSLASVYEAQAHHPTTAFVVLCVAMPFGLAASICCVVVEHRGKRRPAH